MFKSPVSKLTLLLSALFSLLIILAIYLSTSLLSATKLVFCDVGQGDAAYIRIKNRFDLLIDAGPGNKILNCLGKHMPFYDRSIELAIISHPQKDHFGGLLYLLDRYEIKKIWMNQIYNPSLSFRQLLEKIESKQISLEFPTAGENAQILDTKIDIFWPSSNFLDKNSFSDPKKHQQLRQPSANLNDYSLIFSLEENTVRILFTGDASPSILDRLQDRAKIKSSIVKIPHHGSKNGLTVEFLKLANPIYGVISAGINNSYGHPSSKVLEMLKAQKINIRRTDKEGDIVFKIQSSNVKSNPKSN